MDDERHGFVKPGSLSSERADSNLFGPTIVYSHHVEFLLTANLAKRIEPDAASLVALARDGDISAFETVYRMHSARAFGAGMRLTSDRDEAEELAQDAWVRDWERLETFRGDATFGTWIHRLTVNLLLDRKRPRRTLARPDGFDGGAGPDGA